MQKTNKTTKLSTEVVATTEKTPIEVALGIDGDGMTSLRKLYDFLEINPSHYSRWCKRNIIENPFATEGVDYLPIRLNG